jgi:hypothetical protein
MKDLYIEAILGVISALVYLQARYKKNRNQKVATNNAKELSHSPF